MPNKLKPSYGKWEMIASGAELGTELEPRPVPAACCDGTDQQFMVAVSWQHQAPTDMARKMVPLLAYL